MVACIAGGAFSDVVVVIVHRVWCVDCVGVGDWTGGKGGEVAWAGMCCISNSFVYG